MKLIVSIVLLVVALVAAVAIGLNQPWFVKPIQKAEALVTASTDVSATPAVNGNFVEPEPFDSKEPAWTLKAVYDYYLDLKEKDPAKAKVWLEVAMATRPNFANESELERSFLEHIAKESSGENYLRQVGKGEVVRVTNTGYQNGRAQYIDQTLKEGDYYLVDDSGKPWVRSKCKNPLGAPGVSGPPKPPSPPNEQACNTAVNPDSYQHHGTPTPTPGYPGRGNAEEVRENQDSQPEGGTEPTPYGTPGTGAGGTTPDGRHEEPDGSVVTAPVPTTPPVASPSTGVDQVTSPPPPTD